MSVLLAILFTPVVLVLLAFAVGRLLNVARSVRDNLFATVGGYAAGSIVAYNIADGDITDTTFGWNQLYLSVLSAMAFAVLQEMLSPVIPEGRSDVHRAGTRLRDRFARAQRLRKIVGIVRRNGLLSRHSGDGPITPIRLRQTLEEAGGIFVKLGQVLATRPEIIPEAYVTEFAKLHSHVVPVPADAIRRALEDEFGRPVDELLARFDDVPLAAGSIGQVHTARLHPAPGSTNIGGTVIDGEVIVKVQRPGIAASMRADLDVMLRLADFLERRTTWANTLNIGAQIDDFVAGLESELDFALEASNLLRFEELLKHDPTVRVPRLQREFCTKQVVVMERLDGPSVQRRDALVDAGHDPDAVATKLLETILGTTLTHGVFHGDPHPGNFIVLSDGTLGVIDLGYVGRLDSSMLNSLRDLMIAVSTQDGVLAARAVLDVAPSGPEVDSAGLERALTRFITTQFGPIGGGPRISAIADIFTIVGDFGLHVPGDFASLAQSLVKLEGTVMGISPDLRLDVELERIAVDLTRPHLGDVPGTIQDELLRLVPLLRDLPQDVERISRQLVTGELTTRVRHWAHSDDRRFVQRLVNRALLVVLTIASAAFSLVLFTMDAGPNVTDDLTLTEVIGVVGLGSSMILWMRMLLATIRDS